MLAALRGIVANSAYLRELIETKSHTPSTATPFLPQVEPETGRKRKELLECVMMYNEIINVVHAKVIEVTTSVFSLQDSSFPNSNSK